MYFLKYVCTSFDVITERCLVRGKSLDALKDLIKILVEENKYVAKLSYDEYNNIFITPCENELPPLWKKLKLKNCLAYPGATLQLKITNKKNEIVYQLNYEVPLIESPAKQTT